MKRWLTFVLAVEVLGVVVFSLAYDSLDFRIYWLGGHVVMDDARLYEEQIAAHWYTNTPFMAALFTPMAAIPLTVARLLWQLGSLAAFVWACASTLRLSGRSTSLKVVVAGGLLLAPVWHSFFQGQVNLLLLGLVLADMHRVAQGRPAGIGIGIATAIKLTPAIFVVLLLVTRRTKDAFTAAATFAVCTLLAFAIAPDASRLYWRHTFYDTSRVGVTYISNQSPNGMLNRVLRGTAEVGDWYTAIPLTIGVLGLALAFAWVRRGDWLTATAITGMTGLLVSPISWAHHWVWVLPALAVLVRNGDRVIAAFGYVLFALAPMWWTPHNGDPREYGINLLTPVANCYLIAGLFFLIYTAVRLRRTPPGRPIREPSGEPVRERSRGPSCERDAEPGLEPTREPGLAASRKPALRTDLEPDQRGGDLEPDRRGGGLEPDLRGGLEAGQEGGLSAGRRDGLEALRVQRGWAR